MAHIYSQTADLLIGDLSANQDEKDRAVSAAHEEVDGALGARYLIPLTPVPTGYVLSLLKQCTNLIATGRFILARAMMTSDLQPYGLACLQEGQAMLARMVSGELDLTGATVNPVQSTGGNGPSLIQYDETSAVEAFNTWASNTSLFPYETVPIWQPGSSS